MACSEDQYLMTAHPDINFFGLAKGVFRHLEDRAVQKATA